MLYQNGPMYCPSCGTEINGFPCPVCGATSLTAAAGRSTTVVYAGWWTRVGATFFDNLILLLPTLGALLIGDALASASVGVLLSIAVRAAYLIYFLSRPNGQTPGNRIMGTRVRDAATGGAITMQQAVSRWVLIGVYGLVEFSGGTASTTVSTWTASLSLVALIDNLYPLMNERKQTWHDRFAGTAVVRV